MRCYRFLWFCGKKCILEFLHRIFWNEILQATHDIRHQTCTALGISRGFLDIGPKVGKVLIEAVHGVVNDTVPLLTDLFSRNELVSNLHDLIAVTEEVETAQKEGGVTEEARGGHGRGVGPEVRSSI